LPVLIKQNCDYEDDYYDLIIDGLGERETKEVLVKGHNYECEEEIKKEIVNSNIEYNLLPLKDNYDKQFNISLENKKQQQRKHIPSLELRISWLKTIFSTTGREFNNDHFAAR